ncbi:phosphonate ABC transporter, permease protein PhnE [Chelatococcus sp. SYSU_G07232]|uniref:Phosphonate ABC transporter, permease protein PhnE n=1 Tax=Chelatococcus albus TaxID=3047466 RepID=A0ABT7AIA0_9HYPH|nr:phosphonate ABC transporter, permease protein PhnE [Chelatococcus sp. SYSU_G07232]MDJ1159110.1 phosphonate ABC transporter, permease protein PhnE [Chelatococcus sp. SYSU_G07232]
MAPALTRLPDAELARLAAAYRAAVAARRRQTLLFLAVLAVLVLAAARVGEVDPARFAANLPRFTHYIRDLVPPLTWANLGADLAEWFWGWKSWGRQLLDTLLIAYMGTLAGAAGAFCLAFLASANLVRSRAVLFATRRFLEFCRTVPEIVFALVFVVAFGLGPMPGVLAVAVHTLGALGKLFAEVVENIDMKPVEGVSATGATWVGTVRFAVVPQVLPNFASCALLRFEINVRSAAVMGFVGAGGIGQDLLEAVRKFYYTDVSAILVMIILTVSAIDLATEVLRHRLIGWSGER